MYKKHKGGSEEIVQGLPCQIPPVGMVYNYHTGELEPTQVYSRSTKKEEQYWERFPLPAEYNKKRESERKRQEADPMYFDTDLEAYRQKEWHRRLYGMWFMNNGKPTFIPGSFYFFLNWWYIEAGYPKYRDTDRRFFYFWEYCVHDPLSLGMTAVEKRRGGKTSRATCIIYERTSRMAFVNGGIQSKTGPDAQVVFNKMVTSFIRLPHFFKPMYDQSSSERPKGELRFIKTPRRGRKVMEDVVDEQLESKIDWKSSEEIAYDGQQMFTLIRDEEGKAKDIDVWERHLVTRYCCELDGEIVGKILSITTVEEMESGGEQFKKIIDNSDQYNRTEYGFTPSGLYRYLCPAYDTLYHDAYGFPDVDRAKRFFLDKRASLAHDTRALYSEIRKNPFNWEEAFIIDGKKCLYDPGKLNNRLQALGGMINVTERGNFVWAGGERDTKVVWESASNGRWEICWMFEEESKTNQVIKRGDMWYPANQRKFVMGVDPFDHDVTEDGIMSNGASLVLKRYDPTMPEDDPYQKAFVCRYKARPQSAKIFYEDMIKQAVYYGCPVLFEDQKQGIKHYFDDRGYSPFLIWYDGREKPGISASAGTIQNYAELTEDYINSHIDRVFFSDLIREWLAFDIKKTTKFDLAVAAGYTLVADDRMLQQKQQNKFYDVSELFPGLTSVSNG